MKIITKDTIALLIQEGCIKLNSTHKRLCLPIIVRIYKKMSAGIKFSGIKVNDSMICDGHHRYIASIFANISLEQIPTNVTAATEVIDWSSVIFDDEDWDTPAKINMLNFYDAEFNNTSIEEILNLLK